MKRIFLALALVSLLGADILDEKIKTLVDSRTYVKHQKLIDVVFRNRAAFFIGENIDYIKVVETLKDNGLLDIFYQSPADLTITFNTSIYADLFVKCITDILREMGYNYYLTKEFQKNKYYLNWSIGYTSDHVIDPVLFSKKLKKYNMTIHELIRKGKIWNYSIGSGGITLPDAYKLSSVMPRTTLLGPDGEYWLEIRGAPKTLFVESKARGAWYPKVIFYNKNLQIIKVALKDHAGSLSIAIPAQTKFIKLSDAYSSDTMKKGIYIYTR
ncbi:MAG: hypothetical protein ACTTIC_07235 [Helicobacteraceae bacterium]